MRALSLALLVSGVAAACLPFGISSGPGAAEDQLATSSKAWSRAFYRADLEAMHDLELDSLLLVLPDGEVWIKPAGPPEDSLVVEPGLAHSKQIESVRRFGSTAVLIGRLSLTDGAEHESLVFTEVWVKRGGHWRIGSAQWTAVAP